MSKPALAPRIGAVKLVQKTPNGVCLSIAKISTTRVRGACEPAYHTPLRRGAGSGRAVMQKLKGEYSLRAYRGNANWASRFVIMEALCQSLTRSGSDGKNRP